MKDKLNSFLTGAMIAIILFTVMMGFAFIGLFIPLLFAITFGPIVGMLTLLLAIGVIGGLSAMIFDKL